ncbi:MAG: metallophosphoesterase [Oscillospiraceae bacterium]|nr:metallophosphoesterase [Oscillospiraceae bacterium]
MPVFAISDLHLSLAGQNKSMEIFGGRWQGYVEKLEKNWNTLIKKSDSVVVPGDISWGETLESCMEDFEFLNSGLNGVKYILKGNHDFWWDTMTKMTRIFEKNNFNNIKILHNNAYICEDYIICGSRGWFFEKEDTENAHNEKILNREAGRLELSVQAAKKLNTVSALPREIIAFLHYPPVWGSSICVPITDVLERSGIKRCCFGHVHNAPPQKIKRYNNIDFELISADYLNFMPVKIHPG